MASKQDNVQEDIEEMELSQNPRHSLLDEPRRWDNTLQDYQVKKSKKRTMLSVNREMILPKLMYFLLFSVLGASLPFFIGLMKDAGLTTFQAGLISGMRNLFFFICLLWGILADYSSYRRLLFYVVSIGTLIFLAPTPFVSYHLCKVETPVNTSATNTSIYNDVTMLDESCRDKQFYVFMFFMFASACFDQAMMAFSDSLVVNLVLASSSPDSFGVQRSFGSIGFGVSSLIVGIAIDNNNIINFPKYGPSSFVVGVAIILIIPVSTMLYGKSKWETASGSKKFSIVEVLKMLLNVDKLFFLFTVLIMGTGFGLVNGLQFIFMTDEINASDTQAGLSLSLSFISEFVMFPFTKHFLKYLRGPTNCIALGAFSYFLRYLLMSYAHDPWLVISFQLFHAFGFALYWAAAIAKVSGFANKNCLTTLLAIVSLTQFGLGNLIANILGGYLYERFGGRLLYRYTSFVFAALTVLLLVFPKFSTASKKEEISNKNEKEIEVKP